MANWLETRRSEQFPRRGPKSMPMCFELAVLRPRDRAPQFLDAASWTGARRFSKRRWPWHCFDGAHGCDCLDDHLRLGHGIFIGQRHSEEAPVARRVKAASRAAAPPVRHNVGLPDGRLTTPMSRQEMPSRRPVPSALAQASLAAKRFA